MQREVMIFVCISINITVVAVTVALCCLSKLYKKTWALWVDYDKTGSMKCSKNR